MYEKVLKEEERVSLELRALYQKYGYLPYKMSQFEGYDLYVSNKEFLMGEGVITFNDGDGKLMALKPDVTLSILKNDGGEDGKRKVYYDESVYRISPKTKQFKEIRQVGLECIGDIGVYDVYETVLLAAESLAKISGDFILNISHLGVVSAILKDVEGGEECSKALLSALAGKNAHEMQKVCDQYEVSAQNREKLQVLVSAYGNMQATLAKIEPLCQNGEGKSALSTLQTLCKLLSKTPYFKQIRLDFSVGGDMHYYDDVLFKGYIAGIGESLLSGGRYDKVLARMGRSAGAIGFAVCLDLLEGFEKTAAVDVDVLVLYDDRTDLEKLQAKISALIGAGKSVRVQAQKGAVRASEVLDLTGGKV